MRLLLTILGALALVVILFLSTGLFRQRRSISQIIDALLAAPLIEALDSDDGARLESLPAPVARYLRHVLGDGWRPIRVARLSQVGELRTDMKKDRWSRFAANQIVVPSVNGFVWNARVSIAPLLHVRVRDAYVGGQGSGRVSFLSAFPMASDSSGSTTLAR